MEEWWKEGGEVGTVGLLVEVVCGGVGEDLVGWYSGGSVRRGRRDFSHGWTKAGLAHDKLGHFSLLGIKIHDILGYVCMLKGGEP
jgi:hypothetical protein